MYYVFCLKLLVKMFGFRLKSLSKKIMIRLKSLSKNFIAISPKCGKKSWNPPGYNNEIYNWDENSSMFEFLVRFGKINGRKLQ